MRPKPIFGLLLVLSLGLAAFVVVRAMPKPAAVATAAPSPPPPKTEILVAARPLQPGILLRDQDVTWGERNGAAQAGEIVRPTEEKRIAKPESDEAARSVVYGAALREGLAPGQALWPAAIVKPGDREFLQTVLLAGRRAITIPILLPVGNAGLTFPGDHV